MAISYPRLQIFQILAVLALSMSHLTLASQAPKTEPSCNDEVTDSPLYPPIEPYNKGFLKVSDIHQIYYEESGNPSGRPVVVVHGGPGAGTEAYMRRFFDPKHYRIILFDQRGAGQSLPHADLRENTTWNLVADMERLREHLKIRKWMLFGGSWGSTLSLVYAEEHPDRVRAMVLRGIFLCRKAEIDWMYQGGAARVFPEAWERFISHIPEAERGDLVTAYHKRVMSSDPAVRLAAAKEWSIWEGSASNLDIKSLAEIEADFGADKFALAFASIELHYFLNRAFLPTDNHIIENASRIAHIPARIVHGRYDMVCPIDAAYDLKKALSNATFTPTKAGHAAGEPENTKELVKATNAFREL